MKPDFEKETIEAWRLCRQNMLNTYLLAKKIQQEGFQVFGWNEWVKAGYEDWRIWSEEFGSDWRTLRKRLLAGKL